MCIRDRAMIEECRDKQRQAEQERDYALSHQKKVEMAVSYTHLGWIQKYLYT